MKKEKNEKFPHFKDIWTHIPPPKKYNDMETLSDWVKSIIDKVEEKTKKESKILVVDDEIEVLNSLKLILEHSGYSVDTATNGIEALDKLSRVDFNLILSDIRMPAMNGIELCEITKNHPQLNRIPVILFSGYYDTFESCADFFLAKPIDSQTLLNVINKIFEKYQIAKEVEKIGEKRRKIKHLQLILIDQLTNLEQLQMLLDFIWIFQPKFIPILKLSSKVDLSINEIRNLLILLEKQDTVLIVEDSPVLRSLLKSELTFLGGNPSRISDTLENVKKRFF